MKILYCLAGTFNSGGMERIVIKKANWLANNGFEVVIATTEQQGRQHFFPVDNKIRCIDLGINYSDNPYNGNILVKYNIRHQKLALHKHRLTELLVREKPDITVSTYGNEVDFLYKIDDGSKKVVEIHFSRWFRMQGEQPNALYKIVNKYLTWRDRHILKRYDTFVCLTHEDRTNWGDIGNIRVIPNFIEPLSIERTSSFNKQVIAVGRLSFQKGYDRLIRAWKIVNDIYPDWILKIYGNGKDKEELLKQILDLNLTDVIEICTPVRNIFNEYKKSAVFALSSRYEGLPMVMLEAMQCGLPIVAFACQCGPKDLIEDGVNGFLVPEGDVECLANRIIRLIEDGDLRESMGQASYHTSLQYNSAVVMKEWVSLFNSLHRQ